MKNKFKHFLKNSPIALRIVALLHNIIYFNLPMMGNFSSVFLRKTKFRIKGTNNIISCGVKTRLTNCLFHISGNNSEILIGDNCILKNLELWIEDLNGSIIIGKNTTIEGGHIAATEGKSIRIGIDCMFSHNVQIRNGDSHPIFNIEDGKRVNNAQSINIGDHVWIGANVTILKGSEIANNCIVGTGSIVSGKYLEENAIYVGNPAKIVKKGTNWERPRNEQKNE